VLYVGCTSLLNAPFRGHPLPVDLQARNWSREAARARGTQRTGQQKISLESGVNRVSDMNWFGAATAAYAPQRWREALPQHGTAQCLVRISKKRTSNLPYVCIYQLLRIKAHMLRVVRDLGSCSIELLCCCLLLLTDVASLTEVKVDRTSCNVSSWHHVAT
jgi:hypothetical protein